MIEVHFEPDTYEYYIYKFLYTNSIRTHYIANDEIHPILHGQRIEPFMILNGDTYEELKHHFLTEHEQPLEAKQAVIDELRDIVRVEWTRVDQLLTKVIGEII